MNKINRKNEAKILRATTFAIAEPIIFLRWNHMPIRATQSLKEYPSIYLYLLF